MEIELKTFYYINKFRNSWFCRTELGKKVLFVIISLIVVNIIIIIPNFLSFQNAVYFFIFLGLAIFMLTYRPRKPSPMERAGYEWAKGQQRAHQEEVRRRQEQRGWQRINRFMRR